MYRTPLRIVRGQAENDVASVGVLTVYISHLFCVIQRFLFPIYHRASAVPLHVPRLPLLK